MTDQEEKDNKIGRRIRFLRETRLDLGQRRFGMLIGMDRVQVNKYEQGHHIPTIAVAQRLAGALGVTIDQLVSDEDDPIYEGMNDRV